MGNTIKRVNKYTQDYVMTEYTHIIDGDIFKIIEEYKDDNGDVVYVREYYPTTDEVIKAMKERKLSINRKNKIVEKNKRRVR